MSVRSAPLPIPRDLHGQVLALKPASDAFHDVLGFTQVGWAKIHEGRKTVRYLEARLGDRPR